MNFFNRKFFVNKNVSHVNKLKKKLQLGKQKKNQLKLIITVSKITKSSLSMNHD